MVLADLSTSSRSCSTLHLNYSRSPDNIHSHQSSLRIIQPSSSSGSNLLWAFSLSMWWFAKKLRCLEEISVVGCRLYWWDWQYNKSYKDRSHRSFQTEERQGTKYRLWLCTIPPLRPLEPYKSVSLAWFWWDFHQVSSPYKSQNRLTWRPHHWREYSTVLYLYAWCYACLES